jgi:hypothetical protein
MVSNFTLGPEKKPKRKRQADLRAEGGHADKGIWGTVGESEPWSYCLSSNINLPHSASSLPPTLGQKTRDSVTLHQHTYLIATIVNSCRPLFNNRYESGTSTVNIALFPQDILGVYMCKAALLCRPFVDPILATLISSMRQWHSNSHTL